VNVSSAQKFLATHTYNLCRNIALKIIDWRCCVAANSVRALYVLVASARPSFCDLDWYQWSLRE